MAFRPALLIAEIGQAHDGSLGQAIALCTAVKKSGFDAVKFQCHIAEEESTLQELFRVNVFPQDDTRYEYWNRTSFNESEWLILIKHCQELGLRFGISPFSLKALELARRLDSDFIKIGSGEVFNQQLIENLNEADSVIFSGGMTSPDEVKAFADRVMATSKDVAFMHCVSKYPCHINECILSAIPKYSESLKIPVGYSDHSGNVDIARAALAFGAELLEVHVAFSRDMFGPDSTSSLIPTELEELSNFRNALQEAAGDYNILCERESDPALVTMRKLFGRSIALRSDLPSGHCIHESDIVMKKPAGGFTYEQKPTIVGKILKTDYSASSLLLDKHL